jgi:hypothetical protein
MVALRYKVMGSIPNEVIGFNVSNPSSHSGGEKT